MWTIPHDKFPPYFERRTCSVCSRSGSTLSFLFFAKKFFRSAHAATRMRWSGQIFGFWLLVPHCGKRRFSPAFTAPTRVESWLMGSRIQLQQRYCPDSHGFFADPLIQNSQRTVASNSGCGLRAQDLFNLCRRRRAALCLPPIHHSTSSPPAAPDSLARISCLHYRNNFRRPT